VAPGTGPWGIIKTFLGVTSAAVLGGLIGEAIARPIYDESVQPAIEYETGVIEKVIAGQKPADIARAIGDVEGALQQLREASFPGGFDLGPISGIMQLLSTQEREILEQQLVVLKEQLAEARADAAVNKDTSAKLREAGLLGGGRRLPNTRVDPFGGGGMLPNTALPMGPGGAVLPNTAYAMGAGGVGMLPNTAMTLLREIATNTRRLPPIFTRVEQAAHATQRAVQDAKFAQMQGLTGVRIAIDRMDIKPRVSVTANISTTISTASLQTRITRQQIAVGYRGGLLEGA
jgi:hypothetical protein